jgi:hypothetical protein
MRRALYPDDWEDISRRVRARSGGRCECRGDAAPCGCGLHRGRRCEERAGKPAKWARGKVVLTVHHKDGDKASRDESRMGAFCQRCHLRSDRPLLVERRKAAEDARTGQRRLPGMEPLRPTP